LAENPPDAEELETRKATVSGSFSRSIETIDGIAGQLGELALYDVPLEELGGYLAHVEALDGTAVQAFARTMIADDPFVVLTGDAAKFADTIRATYADVTLIPLAQLDLGRPNAMR
jgi:zinc protease